MNREWIRKLPKIELHCHLDGSVRPERMLDHLRRKSLPVPPDFVRQISVGEDCASLAEYLRCFTLPVSWLQSRAALTQAVEDLLEDCAAEHIRYIEIRFAPVLHRFEGLSYQDIFSALDEGRARSRAGVACGFLVCALRNFSMEDNLAMLEAAKEWHPSLVCGADLAGDEDLYPVAHFAPYLDRVRALGMPLTVHAGETGNWHNIAQALDLGARRIGHGIAMREQRELLERVRGLGAGIELCPTSNFQTKASAGWDAYPLRDYLRRGILATVNTDNPTVSRTTLTRELTRAVEEGGCTREDIVRLQENACAVSFAPEAVKERFRRELGVWSEE